MLFDLHPDLKVPDAEHGSFVPNQKIDPLAVIPILRLMSFTSPLVMGGIPWPPSLPEDAEVRPETALPGIGQLGFQYLPRPGKRSLRFMITQGAPNACRHLEPGSMVVVK